MPQLQIAPSINDLRSQALLELIARLDTIDLSQILVYRLDSTPDSALLALAWQFDMLAPQWQLSATSRESVDKLTNIDALTNIDTLSSPGGIAGVSDADSLRSLLKTAIPLHRTRGTPYAIKTALGALGWGSVTLQEGQSSWGGTSYPTSQGWAVFRVLINVAVGQAIATDAPNRASEAINFFKPARSLLDSLWFNLAPLSDSGLVKSDLVVSIFSQTDTLSLLLDQIGAPAWPVSDILNVPPLYTAQFRHIGITYGSGEPAIADSGVVVNGAAISANG